MKKFALTILIALSASAFFFSCSSSTDSTSDTTNYYPFKIGNYWVYNTTTKTNGKTTNSVDSTIIKEQLLQLGQQAFRYENYVDVVKGNDSYQYTANNRLYTLIKSVIPSDNIIQIPSSLIPDSWVVIADNNSTAWNIFSLDSINLPINYSGFSLTLIGKIDVKGQKAEKVSVNFMGKDYTAQKFIMNLIINGQLNYSGIPIPINNFTIQTYHYYVENIGLVKSETLPSTLSLGGINLTTPESLSILTNYNVDLTTK